MVDGERCRDLREEFRTAKLGLNHENSSLFVIPQCFKPRVYIAWVVFWLLFYASTICLDIYYNVESGARYFIYLTNWAYLLQATHVLLDFSTTIFTHLKRKEIRNGLFVGTPWYIKVLWAFFNVNNAISLLVTITYYTLLEADFNHSSVNKHLLNTVYTLLHLVFSAKPVQILHFYQPMIFGLLYLLFSIIYHALGNDPIYTVLDWSDVGKASLLGCLALFLGIPLMHLVCFSLHTLRRYTSWKCLCENENMSENGELKREITRDVELQQIAKPPRTGSKMSNTVTPESNHM